MNARRITRIAATLTSVGAGAVAAASAGLVLGQSAAVRRRPGIDPRTAPDLPPTFGDETNPLVRLVILGDSVATGVGVTSPGDSLGALVASNLAATGYRVQARSVAVPNSLISDVKIQASRALITSEAAPFDVALIAVGAMDASRWVGIADIERAIFRTVSALRNAGLSVVLITAPDLSAATCVRGPLRWIWGWRSAQVARAQQQVAEDCGAQVVNLHRALGSAFAGDPSLLAEDGFHPSRDGYRAIANAVAPAVAEAARTALSRR